MNKNLLSKIFKISLLVLLIVLIVSVLLIMNSSNHNTENGHITVIIKNIDNEIVDQSRFEFFEGDTVFDVLNDNYDLDYKDDVYGHFILGFNDYDLQTDGLSKWLWFEVGYLKEEAEYNVIIDFNDYDIINSSIGIDGIELKNNMILGVLERDNTHETSLLDKDSSNNITKTIEVIGYIILCVGLALFVIMLIIDKDKKPMKVKDICLMGLFTAVLFVQEQLLVFLPNIQLTFLLIVLYTKIFGVKKALMIVFVHVILDNMIMGSFTFITMIPMLVGYTVLVFLTNLVKDKNLLLIVLFACIGSIIYSYMFVFMNKIVYDIDIITYLISDLPFEILLILSTILTITYLFRPLEKVLNNLLNNEN